MHSKPVLPSFAPPTKAEYERRMKDFAGVFPREENPGILHPHESFEKFAAEQKRVSVLRRNLQTEMFSLLRQDERNDWEVNGMTLHDSQRANMFWGVAMLSHGGKNAPDSQLLVGPAGIGKTLNLGRWTQALTHLQIRELFSGTIAFCTSRAYHMTTKTVGCDHALREMLQAPPREMNVALVRSLYRDLVRMFPKFNNLLTIQDFIELFSTRTGDDATEYSRLQKLLTNFGTPELLETLVTLLLGKGTTVAGMDEEATPEILTLDSDANDEADRTHYAGDAAFGIPVDYPVHADKSWNALLHPDAAAAKVILTTTSSFTRVVGRNDAMLRNVGAVVCDEVRKLSEMTFQNPVREAGREGNPLVFGATNVNYGLPWDAVSPSRSLRQSAGKELPNMRVRLLPPGNKDHYPAESEAAVRQFLKAYFERVPALGKQPYEMDTLLAVHPQLIGYVGRELRERYAADFPNLDAQIHRFDGKARDQNFAGKSQKAILEAWFIRSREEGPNILITNPDAALDALDLPNIEQLCIGTRIQQDALYRLIGRALHNNRHRSEGKDYGVLITQQQFSNGSPASTPFGVIDHGLRIDEEQGFDWKSGAILLSEKNHKAEARRLKNKKTVKSSKVLGRKAKRGTKDFPIADGGIMLIQTKAQRAADGRVVMDSGTVDAYEKLKPTHDNVDTFMACMGARDIFATYHSSITLLAAEAVRSERSWTKAVIAKIAELRQRGNNGTQ